MNAAELRDFIRANFSRTAFRLEVLQQYEVASDGNDFGRYLAGAEMPTPERKQPWLDRLRSDHANGLRRRRVRLVTRPVTDYTRYECEWSYAPNGVAGEAIRILDLGERDMPASGPLVERDWWLLDDQHLLAMHYGDDGEFLEAGLQPDEVAAAITVRDQLWAAAEPFPAWWHRHSELHNDRFVRVRPA